MIRKIILTLFLSLLSFSAQAQIVGSLPYNLTNGTTADASQVMANFNAIVTGVNTNAASGGINSTITQLTGLTTPLSEGQGGTGNTIGWVPLGTSASGTGPRILADATTGLYTAGAAKVDISVSGTKICEWSSAAETCTAFVPTASSTSTGLALPAANQAGIFAGGNLSHNFITAASSVNYVQSEGEPTGTYPILAGAGTDATVGLDLATQNGGSTITRQARIQNTTGAVDYVQITGGATGTPGTVTVSAQGSDTNVNLNIVSKGTGTVQANGAPVIASVTIQKFTSGTSTYTPHAGNVYDIVECVGGGGGGGGGGTSGSGGGGSGAYARAVVAAPGAQTVTVGAGGTGAGLSSGDGNNGNNTSFGSICAAGFGSGGQGSGGSGFSGGAGGTATAGDIQQGGTPGGNGLNVSSHILGGSGGSSFFGGGGLGGNGGNGSDGTSCGAGGGGGSSGAGANGVSGCVFVTEFNNQ